MLGIYFSGTGNTKFCVEYLLQQIDESAKCYSIEDQQAVFSNKKGTAMLGGSFNYPLSMAVPFVCILFILLHL